MPSIFLPCSFLLHLFDKSPLCQNSYGPRFKQWTFGFEALTSDEIEDVCMLCVPVNTNGYNNLFRWRILDLFWPV